MKKQILSLVLVTFTVLGAYTQDFVSEAIRGTQGVSNPFVSFGDESPVKFNPARVKSLFKLDANTELVLKETEHDKLGYIHYRYYQTYRSVPIENTLFTIHTKGGILKSVTGTIVTNFNKDMLARSSRSISNTDAVNIAMRNVNAEEYAWQNENLQSRLKENLKFVTTDFKPTANLVWFSAGHTINPRKLRLCYKVDLYATKPLSHAFYFVDALTGNLLGKKDRIFRLDTTGTAKTAYSGKRTIHSVTLTQKNYRLFDFSKGNGIYTVHGESDSFALLYTSPSPDWELKGKNIAALDAHYGSTQAFAYYMENFGRNSYDGKGSPLLNLVNDKSFNDVVVWDGFFLYYGIRSDGTNGGTTGIDIVGHEFTHAVIDYTSNLEYAYESGAVSESIGDIMGKCIQFWSKPADVDWRVSNDMDLILRNMKLPKALGQPDTYLGKDWYTGDADNGGVHINSGVGNFMFYLLVNGGSGFNDNGDTYEVKGIGLDKASQIIYRSNAMYLTPQSGYNDWRLACEYAALDLYGVGSVPFVAVQDAFHAVGIGEEGGKCIEPEPILISVKTRSAQVGWPPQPGAIKFTLQYKENTASDWTTVNGINTNYYNITGLLPNTNYRFRVRSICQGSLNSAFSPAIPFQTLEVGLPPYCLMYGSTELEYINRIAIGDIDNPSGDNQGYANFTNLTTDLAKGSNVPISMQPGFKGEAYEEYWEVYIDYNQNGVFDLPKERVVKNHYFSKLTEIIKLPATGIKTGKTLMRVVMHFNSYLDTACGPFTEGEVEDYSVKIVDASPFALNDVGPGIQNSILVSPNPVKGSSAYIILNIKEAAPATIKISDLSGRIIRSETLKGATSGKNSYPLRNLNLLPGTYFITAEQRNGIIARNQFIIDK